MTKAAAKVEPVAEVEPAKVPTLDERIAGILASDDHHPSETLAALIAETDTEIERCDQTSRDGRAASIDPARLDGIAQRARAEDAEFLASRYRAGVARLRELHTAAQDRERSIDWNRSADNLENYLGFKGDELQKNTRGPRSRLWT